MRALGELIAVQLVSGDDWPEEFKLRTLKRYRNGSARKYFAKMKASWAAEDCIVVHLLNEMLVVYEKERTVDQATRLMKSRKTDNRN